MRRYSSKEMSEQHPREVEGTMEQRTRGGGHFEESVAKPWHFEQVTAVSSVAPVGTVDFKRKSVEVLCIDLWRMSPPSAYSCWRRLLPSQAGTTSESVLFHPAPLRFATPTRHVDHTEE